MTREEFFQLPPTIAVRILFDALDEGAAHAIASEEKPKAPSRPKYDQVIFRRDGVMWASETALEGLIYWHDKSSKSAESGGQYAAQDAKRRDSLARWIAWREWYPDAAWSGERDREHVTAKPPSDRPTVYPRANGQRRAPRPEAEDESIDPNADIPF